MLLATWALSLAIATAPPPADLRAVEAAASAALAPLPGDKAFLFAKLGEHGVEPLFGLHAEQQFAVGSSFKLYILGELIHEVNAGRRQAADTMLLSKEHHGPPSSELAEWPLGSPVTLHTLALKMMWISDNTATDHLHYLLGREAIEARMAAMGHSNPQVNRPLLSTREMTMLRDRKRATPGRAYQKLDELAKRAFLTKELAATPDYAELDFDTASYTLAEWYASPLDMARAMAWLHQHTRDQQRGAALIDVLTVDIKLNFDRSVWKFVGFKGGSEDQILAGNWLLQHASGDWYSYHVFFNNPAGPVDPRQAGPAMEAILKAVEGTLAK